MLLDFKQLYVNISNHNTRVQVQLHCVTLMWTVKAKSLCFLCKAGLKLCILYSGLDCVYILHI